MSFFSKMENLKRSLRDLDYEYADLYEKIKSECYGSLLNQVETLKKEIDTKNNEIKSLREAMFKLTHAYIDLHRRYKNESIYKVSKDDLSDRGKKKQLDIAQVKEVLKIIIDEMSTADGQHWVYKTNSEICGLFLDCLEERIKKRNAAIKQKALAKNKNKRKK